MRELTKFTGLSRSVIHALQAEGRFPQSLKLGVRSVGWLESEVLAWLEERIAARRGRADSSSCGALTSVRNGVTALADSDHTLPLTGQELVRGCTRRGLASCLITQNGRAIPSSARDKRTSSWTARRADQNRSASARLSGIFENQRDSG